MAAGGGGDVAMRFGGSPSGESSSLTDISDPGSPPRLNLGRANIEMDEIVVDPSSSAAAAAAAAGAGGTPKFGADGATGHGPYPEGVRLTKAGVPRKKPGRKPGTTVNQAGDGGANPDAPKVRKPRKPKDPNAPPVQRKRKQPPTSTEADNDDRMQIDPKPQFAPMSDASRQPKMTEFTSMRMDARTPSAYDQPFAQKVQKREGIPESMQSILNAEPEAQRQTSAPVRTSGQAYDPVRSNYDPVRETMVSRDPYGTSTLASPRAPTQTINRASASPSINSIIDHPVSILRSPAPAQVFAPPSRPSNLHEPASVPTSPSNTMRNAPTPAFSPPASESKKPAAAAAAAPAPTTIAKASEAIKQSANGPAVSSKKAAALERKKQQQQQQQQNGSPASSSPKITDIKDLMPPVPERSILDFGKAPQSEDVNAPSIVLHIPLNGESNKYVNFMRMAEEKFGWDALHPRQAEHRDRKARIAAASAALEKQGSGRESGDEMSVDLSEDDKSGDEKGGNGGATSGPDGAPAKPARKKRNFKEDEYDKDDDFVDDSELLWEAQAAASMDGFFVYSGPLVPEGEKPSHGNDGPPKRGRGSRGRGAGSRGGGAGRGGAGTGRGGGPGSRGGSLTRKPRITKSEKALLAQEKAEREKLAQMTSKNGGNYTLLQSSGVLASPMVVDK